MDIPCISECCKWREPCNLGALESICILVEVGKARDAHSVGLRGLISRGECIDGDEAGLIKDNRIDILTLVCRGIYSILNLVPCNYTREDDCIILCIDGVARVGLPPFGSESYPKEYNTLALAIEHERRVELAFEFHRFFDLKRTGRALAVFNSKGFDLSEEDMIFPIPLVEIDINPSLNQNPGY